MVFEIEIEKFRHNHFRQCCHRLITGVLDFLRTPLIFDFRLKDRLFAYLKVKLESAPSHICQRMADVGHALAEFKILDF
ncbi:MAG: hypothetical protein ABSD88_16305, partial [Candidatus Korobacteraceae bacterium]|jgi:hypothetical protein